ncbi:hypothetical protein EDF56_11412 [Novosphingobium sp. PhB165]|nr:hypothetical protein EDF56_11412 [Novosphingobium sp. PhB165]
MIGGCSKANLAQGMTDMLALGNVLEHVDQHTAI